MALGDSITDGRCSTRDPATGLIPADEYNRWTDVLAERLHARYGRFAPAVANQGIAGNRVVAGGNGPPALARLQNDVLDRAGLSAVIFYEGTNDISRSSGAPSFVNASSIARRTSAPWGAIAGVLRGLRTAAAARTSADSDVALSR